MDKNKEDGIDNNSSLEDSASKNKLKNRCRKRKRINSNSSTDLDDVLPENTLDVEKNLHAAALKNNLDDISVKKILKKVVTNDHVLALVKLREEEMDSGTEDGLQPKLTRSKFKELMKVSPSTATWNSIELTPIKHIPVKTRPEVKALIAQELPDDEDDDEYEPAHDEVPSDDEHALESCSDLESQPRTPATPQRQKTVDLLQDGPFKIPQELTTKSLKKDEEATIALRTRSKLSLSSTSIEHIESSFVPPDDIPMPAVDDLWNKFLEECLNPAPNARHEDDDETDPEYNVAADPDANEEDEEALENSIIKISKKELNDLVTELLNVLPQGSEEQLASEMGVIEAGSGDMMKATWEGKQEPTSDEELKLTIAAVERYDTRSVGKEEPADLDDGGNNDTRAGAGGENHAPAAGMVSTAPGTVQISVVEHQSGVQPLSPRLTPPAPLRHLQQRDAPPTAVRVQLDRDMQIYPEQVLILEQQLRQHIQLSTTYFLQLYVHPVHWAHAPKYKEYLESLDKLARANPRSVANVCNLKPALELVKGWEDSVSENTPENAQMVEFIQKEVEKSRKRISQNSVHLGDFPELFKRVVSNSSVFLYPYLLPPCPCRADFTNKKYGYFISEDELMVLGLDQFSKYVEDNPSLYKKPRVHPRKRWSLSTAAELTCKYMFPWMNVRSLLGHVHLVRRTGDKSNPIVKYFQDGTIVPVKHKLLPFNPSLTLYEQPEFEIPRIWIRYLAKGSKRFKDSLYRKSQTTIQPAGVDVATNVIPQQKNPLPIDFTKPIESGRINVRQRPKSVLTNKVDISIETQDNPTSTVYIAANIFTLVNTSDGTKLMPLQVTTNTVDTATAPICTPVVLNNLPENSVRLKLDDVIRNFADTRDQIKEKEKEKQSHCKCCHLLRRICKTRQSLITDYFNSNKKSITVCECKNRKYPNVTNKLKLLVNSYKSLSVTVYNDLKARIEMMKTGSSETQEIETNQEDFIDAMKYQIKLIQRANIARDNRMKVKVNNTLGKFDTDEGNPLHLASELHKIFDVELADLYNEFLMFLTPKQADEIDKFKDYFITSRMKDLIKKTEEQLKGNPIQDKLLGELNSFIFSKLTACEMCCRLLEHMHSHPDLARYTFELFPHKWRQQDFINSEFQQNAIKVTNINPSIIINQRNDIDMSEPVNDNQHNETAVTCEETAVTMDYEADDDSTSDEEDAEKTLVEKNSSTPEVDNDNVKLFSTIKHEVIETVDLSVTKAELQDSNSSDMSMLVMSDDEAIKHEPCEWKRDEDKLILEVLKEFLTPEQIKDKTIIEIIEERHLLTQIAENLDKSLEDVRERVLYLLQVLGSDAK
ncbi:uncharacterized protein LOC116771915 isoform X1 [Danaus plexippus]|uniref:uncharacterized protein LOC116771915 isoform X1 n=2 Tax=Danaus plexippus TaxID=13037 RepID=UPI002AB2998E|nr:uncharacterized protein LOC116771915 isoform X1 [Danaus plexippus]